MGLRVVALQNKILKTSCWLLAAVVLTSAVASEQAAAEEKLTKLHHSVYLGGLYLGGIETQIEQGQGQYKIESAANTSKVFEWAFTWFAEGETLGVVGIDKFLPRQHQYKSIWNKNVRTVKMDYGKSGKITLEKSGDLPDSPDKYTPLDPVSLRNSVDPMTAILMVSNQLEAGEGCTAQMPVFDGSRRYDILLTEKPARIFKPSRYSVFEGSAVGCKIDVVKKGGFRRDMDSADKFNQEVVVWAAPPVAGGRVVPVRMQVDTEFGRMELHLDRYSEGPLRLVSRNLQ